MYGPMSGSMGIEPQKNDSPVQLVEPCRSTQTQEQFARLGNELAKLNELRDALEHALAPILRGEPKPGPCGIPDAKERAPLVPLAESMSHFCDQVNATVNVMEGLLRRLEL